MAVHGPRRTGVLTPLLGPALAAVLLALVHVAAPALGRLEARPRSRWLSIAGGVAVAYVFVHLLPELAAGQQHLDEVLDRREEAGNVPLEGMLHALTGQHAYVLALAGLLAFYGLEKLAVASVNPTPARGDAAGSSNETRLPGGVFWVHVLSFAAYDALIGYLLLHRFGEDDRSLALFTLAMALHFLVADAALSEHYQRRYRERGRWLLAGAVLLGAIVGAAADFGERFLAMAVAFLAGGIILNVLKDEMPGDHSGRFWSFVAGAAGYTLLAVLA